MQPFTAQKYIYLQNWCNSEIYDLKSNWYLLPVMDKANFTTVLPLPHWPLPAVRELTRDGRLSTYEESVLKLSIPGKMCTHGTPFKATIANKTRPAG
jgi:hypothetical protein